MQVRAEQPSLSMIEISKELGARWKLLTSENKIPFEAQAKQDKERFVIH